LPGDTLVRLERLSALDAPFLAVTLGSNRLRRGGNGIGGISGPVTVARAQAVVSRKWWKFEEVA
jgi:hypothetical protein